MPAWRRLDAESLREELRTNLWLVPLIEVVGALVLFCITYAFDRAAFDGAFSLPGSISSSRSRCARFRPPSTTRSRR